MGLIKTWSNITTVACSEFTCVACITLITLWGCHIRPLLWGLSLFTHSGESFVHCNLVFGPKLPSLALFSPDKGLSHCSASCHFILILTGPWIGEWVTVTQSINYCQHYSDTRLLCKARAYTSTHMLPFHGPVMVTGVKVIDVCLKRQHWRVFSFLLWSWMNLLESMYLDKQWSLKFPRWFSFIYSPKSVVIQFINRSLSSLFEWLFRDSSQFLVCLFSILIDKKNKLNETLRMMDSFDNFKKHKRHKCNEVHYRGLMETSCLWRRNPQFLTPHLGLDHLRKRLATMIRLWCNTDCLLLSEFPCRDSNRFCFVMVTVSVAVRWPLTARKGHQHELHDASQTGHMEASNQLRGSRK